MEICQFQKPDKGYILLSYRSFVTEILSLVSLVVMRSVAQTLFHKKTMPAISNWTWWKRVASIFAASQLLACGPFKQKTAEANPIGWYHLRSQVFAHVGSEQGHWTGASKTGTWPPKLEVTEFLGLGLLLFETHMIPKIHSEYDAKDLRN